MAKLNFKEFRMPLDIAHTHSQTGDARESTANMLYLNVNGIRAHALALKIYQSTGEEDYSQEEVDTIVRIAETYALPAFIDGLRDQLKNNQNNG